MKKYIINLYIKTILLFLLIILAIVNQISILQMKNYQNKNNKNQINNHILIRIKKDTQVLIKAKIIEKNNKKKKNRLVKTY